MDPLSGWSLMPSHPFLLKANTRILTLSCTTDLTIQSEEMGDFIRTLRAERATFFSLIPRELVDLVAELVPRAVYEHEKGKLLVGADAKKNADKAADAAEPASSGDD